MSEDAASRVGQICLLSHFVQICTGTVSTERIYTLRERTFLEQHGQKWARKVDRAYATLRIMSAVFSPFLTHLA